MKRKLIALIIFCIISVVMTGCSKEEETETKTKVKKSKIDIAEEETDYTVAEATYVPTPTETTSAVSEMEITTSPTPEITETATETVQETTDVAVTDEETAQADYIDNTPNMTYLGEYTVTFYCPCPEHCNGSLTASGQEAIPWGSVACADLPFGTTVYIEGFGNFTVLDRGVGSGCIDIFVGHHSEIPSYGTTSASTYILN